MNLRLMAMRWLRWKKSCAIVLSERSPRVWPCGQPDVLGVTCARFMIEIEIKRTLSDFRADAKKLHRINRELHISRQPKQFFYLAPASLAARIEPELPAWAGLLCPSSDEFYMRILREAPINRQSKKLSIKECVKLAMQVSNEAISARETAESVVSQWRYGHEPYWGIDYEI